MRQKSSQVSISKKIVYIIINLEKYLQFNTKIEMKQKFKLQPPCELRCTNWLWGDQFTGHALQSNLHTHKIQDKIAPWISKKKNWLFYFQYLYGFKRKSRVITRPWYMQFKRYDFRIKKIKSKITYKTRNAKGQKCTNLFIYIYKKNDEVLPKV